MSSVMVGEGGRRSEVLLIRRRAARALRRAWRDIEESDYDGAAFDAEQAVQLYLKSLILELAGGMPRTHSVRRLLYILGELVGARESVEEYVRGRRLELRALEDAYLNARYAPQEYTREEALDLVRLAEEVIRFAERLTGRPLQGSS